MMNVDDMRNTSKYCYLMNKSLEDTNGDNFNSIVREKKFEYLNTEVSMITLNHLKIVDLYNDEYSCPTLLEACCMKHTKPVSWEHGFSFAQWSTVIYRKFFKAVPVEHHSQFKKELNQFLNEFNRLELPLWKEFIEVNPLLHFFYLIQNVRSKWDRSYFFMP